MSGYVRHFDGFRSEKVNCKELRCLFLAESLDHEELPSDSALFVDPDGVQASLSQLPPSVRAAIRPFPSVVPVLDRVLHLTQGL